MIFNYLVEYFSIIFKATFSPSTADEVIPPEYPAPSPHGYKFSTDTEVKVSWLRDILIGEEVLVSGAVIRALPSPKHSIFFEN